MPESETRTSVVDLGSGVQEKKMRIKSRATAPGDICIVQNKDFEIVRCTFLGKCRNLLSYHRKKNVVNPVPPLRAWQAEHVFAFGGTVVFTPIGAANGQQQLGPLGRMFRRASGRIE